MYRIILYNGGMLDTLISKKAKFSTPERQSEWLLKIQKTLSIQQMACICRCTERTVRDWRRGKFLMPYQSVVLLAKAGGTAIPKVQLLDRYEHTRRAGQAGGNAVIKKYGRVMIDEKVRQSHWKKWWEADGKYRIPELSTKSILTPIEGVDLAEFIGIMLGDGGMTAYQVSVTLHSIDDLQYGKFVASLMQKLFGVTPSVYMRKDVHAYSIVLARKKAVAYLCSRGLVIGNKVRQQICIPPWILENEDYSLACLRGLMDTDGSVYLHRYCVNGKQYQYKKLSFSSASEPLRRDVQLILHQFGSAATCSGTNVRIDAIKDVERYMRIIGSHNPKHLKRYLK